MENDFNLEFPFQGGSGMPLFDGGVGNDLQFNFGGTELGLEQIVEQYGFQPPLEAQPMAPNPAMMASNPPPKAPVQESVPDDEGGKGSSAADRARRCLACRRRRTKCDLMRPCSSCVRNQQECVYASVSVLLKPCRQCRVRKVKCDRSPVSPDKCSNCVRRKEPCMWTESYEAELAEKSNPAKWMAELSGATPAKKFEKACEAFVTCHVHCFLPSLLGNSLKDRFDLWWAYSNIKASDMRMTIETPDERMALFNTFQMLCAFARGAASAVDYGSAQHFAEVASAVSEYVQQCLRFSDDIDPEVAVALVYLSGVRSELAKVMVKTNLETKKSYQMLATAIQILQRSSRQDDCPYIAGLMSYITYFLSVNLGDFLNTTTTYLQHTCMLVSQAPLSQLSEGRVLSVVLMQHTIIWAAVRHYSIEPGTPLHVSTMAGDSRTATPSIIDFFHAVSPLFEDILAVVEAYCKQDPVSGRFLRAAGMIGTGYLLYRAFEDSAQRARQLCSEGLRILLESEEPIKGFACSEMLSNVIKLAFVSLSLLGPTQCEAYLKKYFDMHDAERIHAHVEAIKVQKVGSLPMPAPGKVRSTSMTLGRRKPPPGLDIPPARARRIVSEQDVVVKDFVPDNEPVEAKAEKLETVPDSCKASELGSDLGSPIASPVPEVKEEAKTEPPPESNDQKDGESADIGSPIASPVPEAQAKAPSPPAASIPSST